jgi:hypothetical protein
MRVSTFCRRRNAVVNGHARPPAESRMIRHRHSLESSVPAAVVGAQPARHLGTHAAGRMRASAASSAQ